MEDVKEGGGSSGRGKICDEGTKGWGGGKVLRSVPGRGREKIVPGGKSPGGKKGLPPEGGPNRVPAVERSLGERKKLIPKGLDLPDRKRDPACSIEKGV